MNILISITLSLMMVLSVSNPHGATGTATSASEVDSNGQVTIYFERVSCPTGCPAFSITVRPDGSVDYEGKEFARLRGKRTYKISAASYQAIVKAVRKAKVEQLASEYKAVPGRDAGTIILRVSWNGKTKEIIHFLPSPNAPEALGELEDAIVKNAYPSEDRAWKSTSN
jgi:hypothetical protein